MYGGAPAMNRSAKLFFIPVFCLEAGFFLFVSQHRLIDGDEGFYLLASRLVLQHRIPYIDFFYTQAPLLPYVYAVWLKLFGISWFSARVFCAILSAAVGGLMYEHVSCETGSWVGGTVAVLLFASSSLVFAWYPIVKTFALAVLCLFAAYIIVVRNSTSRSIWPAVLAGTLIGLSIDTRSYLVIVAPVFIVWIVRYTILRPACFLAGLLVGLIPSIVLFVQSPDNFLFNNLGYHAMRSGDGLVAEWQNKFMVALGVFGGSHTGFQFSLITAVGCGLTLAMRKRRSSSLFALWIAFAIGFVSLLPTPSSNQYFSIVSPFLIVPAVCAAADYMRTLDASRTRTAHLVCAMLVIAFIAFGVPSFNEYLFTGYKVPGILDPSDASNWTLQQVSEVSKAVDHFAGTGEEVASFWPGYLFAAKADPYPGFENDFGLVVAPRLNQDKRRQYRILSLADIETIFRSHAMRFAVVGNQGPHSGGPPSEPCGRIVRGHGYTLVAQVGGTGLYEYAAGTPSAAPHWDKRQAEPDN